MGQTTSIPEKDMLRAVAAGNEKAFTKLFNQYHPFLAAHIFRIVESDPITEEIVQDIFLKIWLSRETLPDIENFKAYLIVVSRNHALTALTKLMTEIKRKANYIKESVVLEEHFADEYQNVQSVLIDEAIDTLPERQRQVYLLHRHERLTYAEIGKKLGIGRETVKSHIENAVKGITKHIKSRLTIMMILFDFFKS